MAGANEREKARRKKNLYELLKDCETADECRDELGEGGWVTKSTKISATRNKEYFVRSKIADKTMEEILLASDRWKLGEDYFDVNDDASFKNFLHEFVGLRMGGEGCLKADRTSGAKASAKKETAGSSSGAVVAEDKVFSPDQVGTALFGKSKSKKEWPCAVRNERTTSTGKGKQYEVLWLNTTTNPDGSRGPYPGCSKYGWVNAGDVTELPPSYEAGKRKRPDAGMEEEPKKKRSKKGGGKKSAGTAKKKNNTTPVAASSKSTSSNSSTKKDEEEVKADVGGSSRPEEKKKQQSKGANKNKQSNDAAGNGCNEELLGKSYLLRHEGDEEVGKVTHYDDQGYWVQYDDGISEVHDEDIIRKGIEDYEKYRNSLDSDDEASHGGDSIFIEEVSDAGTVGRNKSRSDGGNNGGRKRGGRGGNSGSDDRHTIAGKRKTSNIVSSEEQSYNQSDDDTDNDNESSSPCIGLFRHCGAYHNGRFVRYEDGKFVVELLLQGEVFERSYPLSRLLKAMCRPDAIDFYCRDEEEKDEWLTSVDKWSSDAVNAVESKSKSLWEMLQRVFKVFSSEDSIDALGAWRFARFAGCPSKMALDNDFLEVWRAMGSEEDQEGTEGSPLLNCIGFVGLVISLGIIYPTICGLHDIIFGDKEPFYVTGDIVISSGLEKKFAQFNGLVGVVSCLEGNKYRITAFPGQVVRENQVLRSMLLKGSEMRLEENFSKASRYYRWALSLCLLKGYKLIDAIDIALDLDGIEDADKKVKMVATLNHYFQRMEHYDLDFYSDEDEEDSDADGFADGADNPADSDDGDAKESRVIIHDSLPRGITIVNGRYQTMYNIPAWQRYYPNSKANNKRQREIIGRFITLESALLARDTFESLAKDLEGSDLKKRGDAIRKAAWTAVDKEHPGCRVMAGGYVSIGNGKTRKLDKKDVIAKKTKAKKGGDLPVGVRYVVKNGEELYQIIYVNVNLVGLEKSSRSLLVGTFTSRSAAIFANAHFRRQMERLDADSINIGTAKEAQKATIDAVDKKYPDARTQGGTISHREKISRKRKESAEEDICRSNKKKRKKSRRANAVTAEDRTKAVDNGGEDGTTAGIFSTFGGIIGAVGSTFGRIVSSVTLPSFFRRENRVCLAPCTFDDPRCNAVVKQGGRWTGLGGPAPLNGYDLFEFDNWRMVAKERVDLSGAEIGDEVARRWKAVTDEERSAYNLDQDEALKRQKQRIQSMKEAIVAKKREEEEEKAREKATSG